MRCELDGVEVLSGESRERCSTSIEAASGYVVTVISVVQSRAVTLVSCYLASLGGETAVSHLRLVPARRPEFSQRLLSAMAGETHARACLLDHAAELGSTFDGHGGAAVGVEISDSFGRGQRFVSGPERRHHHRKDEPFRSSR
ncbi:MAG: hypothetical protein ACXVFQ_17850 [Solirubrobacteraceae bacterium]